MNRDISEKEQNILSFCLYLSWQCLVGFVNPSQTLNQSTDLNLFPLFYLLSVLTFMALSFIFPSSSVTLVLNLTDLTTSQSHRHHSFLVRRRTTSPALIHRCRHIFIIYINKNMSSTLVKGKKNSLVDLYLKEVHS